jgi:hypothetical protein
VAGFAGRKGSPTILPGAGECGRSALTRLRAAAQQIDRRQGAELADERGFPAQQRRQHPKPHRGVRRGEQHLLLRQVKHDGG